MSAQSPGYWFRSPRFRVEPGEDADTNPGIYGRQLAAWLADRLRMHGHPDAAEVAEDWGWAVACAGKPFCLFVACGSVMHYGENGPIPPIPQPEVALVWHCYAAADTPLFARLRKIDVAGPVAALDALLGVILRAERDITLVDAP
jgi:hypothetical protein